MTVIPVLFFSSLLPLFFTLVQDIQTTISYFLFSLIDAKEWMVLAVRNLCENNLENQKIIQNLEPQGPASTPVLDELGLEVELKEDGKVRLKRKDE